MSLKTTVFRALHKVCQAGVWLMLLALMLVGHSAVQAREASFMDAWVIPSPSRAYRLGETVNIPIVIEKGFPWRSARITLNSQKKKQDWEPDPSVVHFSEVTLGEEANGRWASVAYLPVTVKGEGMFNIEGQIHPQGFQGYGKDAVVGFRLGIFSFEGKVYFARNEDEVREEFIDNEVGEIEVDLKNYIKQENSLRKKRYEYVLDWVQKGGSVVDAVTSNEYPNYIQKHRHKKIIKKYEEHREKVFKRVMFDYCLKYCRKPEEVSVEELE